MKTPRKTPLKLPNPWQVALFLSLALGGCGELNTPGDPLVLFASTVDPAYLSEDYTFDFVVSGGLAPYNFELRDGEVPPGLTLANGSLSGTPTRAGNYTFTLQVSDASLSRTVEDFTVEVTEAPPRRTRLKRPADNHCRRRADSDQCARRPEFAGAEDADHLGRYAF